MRLRLALFAVVGLALLIVPTLWTAVEPRPTAPALAASAGFGGAAVSEPPPAQTGPSDGMPPHQHHSPTGAGASAGSATGVVVPAARVDVVAVHPGSVQTVTASVGDVVRQGQVLATVRPALDALREQRLAEAQMQVAESEYRRAQVEAVRAESQARRAQQLRQEGLTAQTDYEAAQADSRLAELRIESAQATLLEKQIAVDFARQSIEGGAIVAPVSGVVTQRLIDAGATLASGDKAFVVLDTSRLRVRLFFDPAQHPRMSAGQLAHVTLSEGHMATGRVVAVGGEAEPASGLVVAEVEVDALHRPAMRPRPGTVVQVHIPAQ